MDKLTKVNPTEFGLKENEVVTIEQAFLPKIQEREAISQIYEQLITKELTPTVCKEAKEVRLKLVKVRTGIAEVHKSQKAYFLAAGKFVDAWKNKETIPVEQMEEKLSEIETYFERLEKERLQNLEAERLENVSIYTEFPAANLSLMSEETFNAYLLGCKVAYDAKIKAEQDAETEILRLIEVDKENARLKAIEDERIRKENEQLKQEAERKQKELEAERKKQAEILAKQKAESDAKQRQIEEAARIEREKLQAELKAKSDKEAAELKAKQESELKAKQEAEKAAKAPIKKQLQIWVDGFEIQKIAIENDATKSINEKFEAFKKWAKLEIEKL